MTTFSGWFETLLLVFTAALIIGIIGTIKILREDKNKKLGPLSPFENWIPVITCVALGGYVVSQFREHTKLTNMLKKIDDKLILKRFWLIGSEYKKLLERGSLT
jgi:hypothetical protein